MNSKDEIMEMPPRSISPTAFQTPTSKVRRRVTMNIDGGEHRLFQGGSARTGVPYQLIINMFLTECREQGKHLAFS